MGTNYSATARMQKPNRALWIADSFTQGNLPKFIIRYVSSDMSMHGGK